jgi:hypothetical protein
VAFERPRESSELTGSLSCDFKTDEDARQASLIGRGISPVGVDAALLFVAASPQLVFSKLARGGSTQT